MTDTKENIMGTLPIGKLLMKMSVPVILSMLVSTLYGVIDSIFVSRLGDNALTAMSLATPISSLIACKPTMRSFSRSARTTHLSSVSFLLV